MTTTTTTTTDKSNGCSCLSLAQLATRAWQSIQATGGFSLATDCDVSPGFGFLVSQPEPSQQLSQEQASPRALLAFIAGNELPPGCFYGGWLDSATGLLWLDISCHFETQEQATRAGLAWGQLAIWDCTTKQEQRLPSQPKPEPQATVALAGHAGNGGLQSHSLGETYPLSVVIIGNRCQARNLTTGAQFTEFAFTGFGNSFSLAHKQAEQECQEQRLLLG